MNLKNVNWLAILASLVACMAIGFLWYGYLFMDKWMALNGFALGESGETMIVNGEEISPSSSPMIINTLVMIVYALFMHWILSRTNSFSLASGFKTGLAFGVIIYAGHAVNNMFAMTSYELTQLDGYYAVVIWTVIGTIIGAWPKKAKA